MRNILIKIKKRLPKGEMYEALKEERHMIEQEQDPFCRRLMLALYKAKKDIFFWGGEIDGKRCLARNIKLYNELKAILHAESVLHKDAIRIKIW